MKLLIFSFIAFFSVLYYLSEDTVASSDFSIEEVLNEDHTKKESLAYALNKITKKIDQQSNQNDVTENESIISDMSTSEVEAFVHKSFLETKLEDLQKNGSNSEVVEYFKMINKNLPINQFELNEFEQNNEVQNIGMELITQASQELNDNEKANIIFMLHRSGMDKEVLADKALDIIQSSAEGIDDTDSVLQSFDVIINARGEEEAKSLYLGLVEKGKIAPLAKNILASKFNLEQVSEI